MAHFPFKFVKTIFKMIEVYYSPSIQFEAMTWLNYNIIKFLIVIHLMNMQNHKENVCKGCFCNTPPPILFFGLIFNSCACD